LLRVGYASPAVFNFRLRYFSLHLWRRHSLSGFGDFLRSSNNKFVALHSCQRPRFSRYRQIRGWLSLDAQALNGSSRVRIQHVVIRAVIINYIILNGDVGHVHRVVDIGNILRWRKDTISQDRLTDKTNIAEVVILRSDIELDIYLAADWLSLINNPWTARG
jgi:hypothetical protein